MIKEKIRRFYDIGSPYYARIYGEHIHDGFYITGKETRAEAQENLTRIMAEKARVKRGDKVLDVGSGLGGSSIWLARERGALTTGITLSQVQAQTATQRAAEQGVSSRFLVMDAEQMDFPEPFDLIWAVGVLTHLEDQERFVRQTWHHLKPGGRLAIFDWMLDENVVDSGADAQIRLIKEGMLLPALFPLSAYLSWIARYGFRLVYAEDITEQTENTWKDAVSVVRQPAVWGLVGKLARQEGKEVFTFLRSLLAMKLAMRDGRVKAGALVAKKI